MKDKEGKIIICEVCKKREAKVEYASEPTFALTHGFWGQNICRKCYIEIIEKGLKNIKENLKKQKELLDKENE